MIEALILIPIILFSITIHEFSHGWTAYQLGDDTPKSSGRLSLNPLKHIDPFFTILMPLLLWYSTNGAFLFGGAKPVPVNPYNFKRLRRDMAITGAAGPIINISIAVAACFLLRITPIAPHESVNRFVLANLAMWNMWLAFFNLIPIPPLDGSRLLAWLLPRELAFKYADLEKFGLIGVMLCIILLSHFGVLGWLHGKSVSVVTTLSGIPKYEFFLALKGYPG